MNEADLHILLRRLRNVDRTHPYYYDLCRKSIEAIEELMLRVKETETLHRSAQRELEHARKKP